MVQNPSMATRSAWVCVEHWLLVLSQLSLRHTPLSPPHDDPAGNRGTHTLPSHELDTSQMARGSVHDCPAGSALTHAWLVESQYTPDRYGQMNPVATGDEFAFRATGPMSVMPVSHIVPR